jgi:transcriptional regulator with XRE-family HTH domain
MRRPDKKKKELFLRQALIEARRRSGITQEGLALKLQKPQSFVSKYECGERGLDFIETLEIGKILGFDILEFIKTLDKQ